MASKTIDATPELSHEKIHDMGLRLIIEQEAAFAEYDAKKADETAKVTKLNELRETFSDNVEVKADEIEAKKAEIVAEKEAVIEAEAERVAKEEAEEVKEKVILAEEKPVG
jgi:outer membrane protein TolC